MPLVYYNAEGIRNKKWIRGIETKYYLDGNKIIAESSTQKTLRYFYGKDGLVGFTASIPKMGMVDFIYVLDSQGNVSMIYARNSTRNTNFFARYEYDAYGNCTVYDGEGNIRTDNDFIGNINPFRWKSLYYDNETGLYYANGSYYDPKTGFYLDAGQISDMLDNAYFPRSLDRNSPVCNNILELAGNPSTAYTNAELSPDPTYNTDKLAGWIPPKWLGWVISAIQLVAGIGLLLIPGAQGIGISMIVGGVIGIASNILGNSTGGGLASVVNGGGAIGVGARLLGLGPVGWITGGLLIVLGAGTIAFGANEIAYGVTGTNFIQEWTGMSDQWYSGLYLGLNIGSAVGQIAGRTYHLYSTRNPIYGSDGSLNRYRYSDLNGNPLFDYDFPHGKINFNHYHGWAGPGLRGRTSGQHWRYWRFLWWLLTRR